MRIERARVRHEPARLEIGTIFLVIIKNNNSNNNNK